MHQFAECVLHKLQQIARGDGRLSARCFPSPTLGTNKSIQVAAYDRARSKSAQAAQSITRQGHDENSPRIHELKRYSKFQGYSNHVFLTIQEHDQVSVYDGTAEFLRKLDLDDDALTKARIFHRFIVGVWSQHRMLSQRMFNHKGGHRHDRRHRRLPAAGRQGAHRLHAPRFEDIRRRPPAAAGPDSGHHPPRLPVRLPLYQNPISWNVDYLMDRIHRP